MRPVGADRSCAKEGDGFNTMKGSSKQKEARVEVLATAVNRLSTGSADQPNPNSATPLLLAIPSSVYATSYLLLLLVSPILSPFCFHPLRPLM